MTTLPPTSSSLPPAAILTASDTESLLWIVVTLALSTFLGSLRSALQHSYPERILAREMPEKTRARLRRLLERADSLATSAAILKITSDLVFMTLIVGMFVQDHPLRWSDMALALAIGAPVLLLFTEALASSLGRHRGDALLVFTLPAFFVLQSPVGLLVIALNALKGALHRLLHLPERPPAVQRIVEDLRGVIEDSEIAEPLAPTQRELIENVVALADVDVAAIMRPRTGIAAIDVQAPLEEAARSLAEHGHSRMPVYEETIDTVIGTIHALDLTRALASTEARPEGLRALIKPAYFVPETKRVSDLLDELRTKKRKMAIVLDEYGGTAGVVTLTDVLAKIVGEIQDEHRGKSESIVRRKDGTIEVEGALHVSVVNEALGLSIPEEEDFQTVGGFVLAELGRFPRLGEGFRHGKAQFAVVEATDRRVLKVGVRLSA